MNEWLYLNSPQDVTRSGKTATLYLLAEPFSYRWNLENFHLGGDPGVKHKAPTPKPKKATRGFIKLEILTALLFSVLRVNLLCCKLRVYVYVSTWRRVKNACKECR